MNFIPKQIRLKNNENVLIRQAEVTDAKALVNVIKEYLDDSEYIPINSEDFNKSELDIKNWINTLISADNSNLLVAEFNGKLIGNLDITGHHRKMLKHTARLGMGILTNWRGLGLGYQMLNYALEWAKTNHALEIITLDVYAENKAGISLYYKLGFNEIGKTPNFIKADDRYYDNIGMWISVE